MDTVVVATDLKHSTEKEYILHYDNMKIRFVPRWYKLTGFILRENPVCIIYNGKKPEIKGVPIINGENIYNRLLIKAVKKASRFFGGENCSVGVIAEAVTNASISAVYELINSFRYVHLVTGDKKGEDLKEKISESTGAVLNLTENCRGIKIALYFNGENTNVPKETILFDRFAKNLICDTKTHINNIKTDAPNVEITGVNPLAVWESLEHCTGKNLDFSIKEFLFNKSSVNLFDIC